MKPVSGKIVSASPLPGDDWAEDDCLCQGKVPDDKRIDIQQRLFDEKRQKWRWKSLVRFHQDCPIHGCHRSQ